jgi:heme-degrading monooxygenase HmoA
MILEIAILNVKKERQHNFEKDFTLASEYISSMEGYIGHSLKKCLEEENKYALFVEWETLKSHEEGFRNSEEYQKWKTLLHHYYDPFPLVEHYETIFENNKF